MSEPGSEPKFFEWLDANGLNVPRDFKFAFTSDVGAARTCPEAPMAAAEAWKASHQLQQCRGTIQLGAVDKKQQMRSSAKSGANVTPAS